MQDCNWLVSSQTPTADYLLSSSIPSLYLSHHRYTKLFFFHYASFLSLSPLCHTVSWKWLSGYTGWWLISSSPLSVLCQLHNCVFFFYSSASKTCLSAVVHQLGFSELHVGLIASSPLGSILSMSPLMFECLSFQQEVYSIWVSVWNGEASWHFNLHCLSFMGHSSRPSPCLLL